MKKSGFTKMPLAHARCYAAVFTFLYSCMTKKQNGYSIILCWAKQLFLLFFPFQLDLFTF